MSGKIYLICKDGEPKYVGFTNRSIEQRWAKHIKDAKHGSEFVLHKAIRKYGPDAFTISLEVEHENEEYCLNELEKLTIESYGTHVDEGGYNMTYGGEGTLGHKHSAESIEKISAAKKGNKSRIGRKHSDESRAKTSAALKGNKSRIGRKHSDESRAKMSAASKGKPKSEEHRKKLSEANYRRWAKKRNNKIEP